MLEELDITNMRQIKALADTTRLQMVNLLIEKPLTGAQLARLLNIPRQRAHYHLKILEAAGAVRFHSEQFNRGLLEKYYISSAKIFHIPENILEGVIQETDFDLTDLLSRSMINQSLVDIKKRSGKSFLPSLDDISQSACHLTRQQIIQLKLELNAVSHHFHQMQQENTDTPAEELITMRLGIFFMQISDPLDEEVLPDE
jgi:DNA-binding transcriptional ArsR family regulator